jgi:hypothetical protein
MDVQLFTTTSGACVRFRPAPGTVTITSGHRTVAIKSFGCRYERERRLFPRPSDRVGLCGVWICSAAAVLCRLSQVTHCVCGPLGRHCLKLAAGFYLSYQERSPNLLLIRVDEPDGVGPGRSGAPDALHHGGMHNLRIVDCLEITRNQE